MRGITIFLLLIPALVALGHDAYLFYERFLNPGVFSIDVLMKEFKFSALGFIWTTYDVNSYRSVVETTDPETWVLIDKALTFKAFYVGLAFAGFFTVLFFILKLFGVGPFAGEKASGAGMMKKGKKSSEPESFRAGAKSKKINYSRK